MTKEAFEAQIEAQRQNLLAIARKRLPESDREDAVQSAILSAWTHLPQLKDETKFDAWLRRILINECNQILKGQKRRSDVQAAMLQRTTQPSSSPSIQEALDELPSRERTLLLMHHEQGYSVRELSKALDVSEDAVKMRLHRARNRLRVILISLLILLMSMAIAIGAGILDIPWFMANRRASPSSADTDHRSEAAISYSGRFLTAEITDVLWQMETLELVMTYSLTGAQNDALITHSGNIGVDGERHDHIWMDDEILPVAAWADGRRVYTYSLDGWQSERRILRGSEDYLPDGKGDAFLAILRFDHITPEQIRVHLADDGILTLHSDIVVRDYETNEVIEHETLTVNVALPTEKEWSDAYEAYHR